MVRDCPNCNESSIRILRLALWPRVRCPNCNIAVRFNVLFFFFYLLALAALIGFTVMFIAGEAVVPVYLLLECVLVLGLLLFYGGLQSSGKDHE